MTRRTALLLTGSIPIFRTFTRYSVAALGWIVLVPFLLQVDESRALKGHLILLGTLLVAFTAAISKMATVARTLAAAAVVLGRVVEIPTRGLP